MAENASDKQATTGVLKRKTKKRPADTPRGASLRHAVKITASRLQAFMTSARGLNAFAIGAVVVLAATTIYWATLGAIISLQNADTLVDPLLFTSGHTFAGAGFPSAHTQLLKWPLFVLIRLFNFSSSSYVVTTVLLCLLTVGALAYILWRIEHRPLVFGTLCLALAAILLCIPAAPYPGGLLPVNMAMLATRNIEYVAFVGMLVLVVRTRRLRSRQFAAAVLIAVLLSMSDRLFLYMGLGAALLMLITYALAHRWEYVTLASTWFTVQVLAWLLGMGGLSLLSSIHLAHFINQAGTVYPFISQTSAAAKAGIYAVLVGATNLGANPVHDITILKDLLPTLMSRLLQPATLAYIINGLVAVGAVYASVQLVRLSITRKQPPGIHKSQAVQMSLFLLGAGVAAIALFVVTAHQYAVDARYVSIILFAALISLATYLRLQPLAKRHVWYAASVLTLGVILGIVAATQNFVAESQALAPIAARNARVAAALHYHPTDALLGDYWRVVPIKQENPNLAVLPLASCTQLRTDLSSSAWQFNMHQHSFAYLLSYDHSLTPYPTCTLDKVIAAYGKPNGSVYIAGTATHPVEQLLFYDGGTHLEFPKLVPTRSTPATVTPVSIDELPNITCEAPTIMSIVAHEDDDLLFMNPDIAQALKANACVRTIYVTTGGANWDNFYWLQRQRGSEAAYAEMLGTHEVWVERIVSLAPNEYVTIATPSDNNNVSLIFMNLPDGGLHGQGFSRTHFESLAKLYGHHIALLHSEDGLSSYSLADLTKALNTLFITYSPTEIYTQSSLTSRLYPDHSDHQTVSRIVTQAYTTYESATLHGIVQIPIRYYVGYPIHQMPVNLGQQDTQLKLAAFLAYARYDGAVCQTAQQCLHTPTYGSYLQRQYSLTY